MVRAECLEVGRAAPGDAELRAQNQGRGSEPVLDAWSGLTLSAEEGIGSAGRWFDGPLAPSGLRAE